MFGVSILVFGSWDVLLVILIVCFSRLKQNWYWRKSVFNQWFNTIFSEVVICQSKWKWECSLQYMSLYQNYCNLFYVLKHFIWSMGHIWHSWCEKWIQNKACICPSNKYPLQHIVICRTTCVWVNWWTSK